MIAAENIAVNPIIEYHAATAAIDNDVTNVNIDSLWLFIYYLCRLYEPLI